MKVRERENCCWPARLKIIEWMKCKEVKWLMIFLWNMPSSNLNTIYLHFEFWSCAMCLYVCVCLWQHQTTSTLNSINITDRLVWSHTHKHWSYYVMRCELTWYWFLCEWTHKWLHPFHTLALTLCNFKNEQYMRISQVYTKHIHTHIVAIIVKNDVV